jgi:hypothetical protein
MRISPTYPPPRSQEDTVMSSLIDRREFMHPYGWAPEDRHPAWKDVMLLATFVSVGIAVTLFAIFMGIPIGESQLWNN